MKNCYGQVLLLAVLSTTTKCMDYGLKWGEKCKIPGQNDFLKPSEECEMSKGLHCQAYQQGSLCGCLIRSSLSWDERASECRRKPGHHCPYINSTDPTAYDRLHYNHKCHVNADCTIVDPIPEIEATATKSKNKNKKQNQEQFAVCKCRPGYKESRDGLVCHSINSSPRITTSSSLTVVITVLVRFLVQQPFT